MKEIINNEIEIEYPESFYLMDSEELAKYFSSASNRKGFRNSDQHMIISIGWTAELNFLTGALVTCRSFISSYDKRSTSALVNYKREETLSKEIGGKAATGFSYSYDARDTGVRHTAKIFTVKLGKRIYIIE